MSENLKLGFPSSQVRIPKSSAYWCKNGIAAHYKRALSQ
jgi:hypothetical protein